MVGSESRQLRGKMRMVESDEFGFRVASNIMGQPVIIKFESKKKIKLNK